MNAANLTLLADYFREHQPANVCFDDVFYDNVTYEPIWDDRNPIFYAPLAGCGDLLPGEDENDYIDRVFDLTRDQYDFIFDNCNCSGAVGCADRIYLLVKSVFNGTAYTR